MKEKNNCSVVQDLLPNYIEKLTKEETNSFIEEHLNDCSECKNIYENMKKDISIDSKKSDKREVKYIKKFNNKMKILKSILIVIFVIVLAIVIHSIRNWIIISDLDQKAREIGNRDNIHVRMDSLNAQVEKLKYNNVIKESMTKKGTNVNFINYIDYSKGDTLISYTKINNEVQNRAENADFGNLKHNFIVNYNEYIAVGEKILSCVGTRIYTEELDGVDCYVLTGYNANFIYREQSKGVKLYIEKDTGLTRKLTNRYIEDGIEREDVVEYTYEFDIIKSDITMD